MEEKLEKAQVQLFREKESRPMYELYGHEMEDLIGLRVLGVYIDPAGQEHLAIETTAGMHYYGTEGGCCSETWFADLVGVKSLIGQIVRKTTARDLADYDQERTRQEEDAIYCYDLYTDLGACSVVFRNSSNGYYGGNIYRETCPVGVLFTQLVADYSA